jgi:hypothetical protein
MRSNVDISKQNFDAYVNWVSKLDTREDKMTEELNEERDQQEEPEKSETQENAERARELRKERKEESVEESRTTSGAPMPDTSPPEERDEDAGRAGE